MNFTQEPNLRACEQLVTLVEENNTNENVLRKLFLQIGIISSDCITVLRPKQSGYGYFAKKGVRNANKFPLEMDEMLLETKLTECKLVYGVDFFSGSEDYIIFVKSNIIPALEGAKKPPAVDSNEECKQEEKRDDPVEKDTEGGNDLSEEEGKEGDNELPEGVFGHIKFQISREKHTLFPEFFGSKRALNYVILIPENKNG